MKEKIKNTNYINKRIVEMNKDECSFAFASLRNPYFGPYRSSKQ